MEMSMNTNELIEEVRNGLVEYQTVVISDEVIISNLNHAMRKVYNHYTRADDNMFGVVHELPILVNERIYELPKTLWSKRVDYMQVPTPGDNAKGYVAIEKIDAKRSHKYNLPDAYSTIPWAWSQLGNEIELYPRPQRALTARLIVQPRLVPLAKTEATVLSFTSPTITCTESVSAEFIARATSATGENYLSICDGLTGELKHLVRYTAALNNSITVAAPGVRASAKGVNLSALAALTDLTIDDTITYQYSSGTSILGEAFDEYLVKYAILSIKSVLNENDPLVKTQLEELKSEYLSDRVGRPGTSQIERLDRNYYLINRYRRSR